MSESVRTAHSRIVNHPRQLSTTGTSAGHATFDPALVGPRSRLLTDLRMLPGPGSASKVFWLGENEVGLPGVSLFVRSEEQPYLRGAINAIESLVDEHGVEKLRRCGVVGQKRSPHVREMAIAASAYGIPAYTASSDPSKRGDADGEPGGNLSRVILAVESMNIDSQQQPSDNAVAKEEAIRFPLHHHAEVVQGQGTVALQLEQDMATSSYDNNAPGQNGFPGFGAVISDIGNGCTLSGICMAFSGKSTQVFGAAPSTGFWPNAWKQYYPDQTVQEQSESRYWDDLEVPMGSLPWTTFTSSRDLSAVFDVDHQAMCAASQQVFAHCGLHVEPDEAAPLAVALFNEDFRRIAAEKARDGRKWTVGIILQPRSSTVAGNLSQTADLIDSLDYLSFPSDHDQLEAAEWMAGD